MGVPSALDVWLGECPRRNSRGESARSGPVARSAGRRALAAEAFASTAPCGSSATSARRPALAAEACASTAYSGPFARSAGRPALAAEAFASTAPSGHNARGASGLALAAQRFASTAPSGPIARGVDHMIGCLQVCCDLNCSDRYALRLRSCTVDDYECQVPTSVVVSTIRSGSR